MNKTFIFGDTHGGEQNGFKGLNSKNFPEGKTLTKKDYVIILGDFGLLWNMFEDGNERYWKKWLIDKPWTTLFLDGNHENFERVNKLPTEKMFGSEVGVYVENYIYHLKRGNVYNINSRSLFVFGGAESYDKGTRREFISWWKEEMPSIKEYSSGLENLKEVSNKVDYILTHDCPGLMYENTLKYRYYEPSSITKFFDNLYNEIDFKEWYCGHHHIDKIVDKNFYFCYNKVRELL